MRIRSSILLLVVLALSFGASTAFAQGAMTVSTPSVTLTSYVKASDTADSTTATVYAPTDDTTYTYSTAANWLTLSSANGGVAGPLGDSNAGTGPDVLTVALNTTAADSMNTGTYQATVTIASSGLASATLTVNLTITSTTTPLTVSSTVNLIFIKNGTTNQAAATTTASVTDSNTSADTFTIGTISQSWLNAVATTGSAYSGHPGTVTFSVAQSAGNAISSLGATTATVALSVVGCPDLVVTVHLWVLAQQPLLSSVPSLSFSYIVGGTVPSESPVTVTAADTQAFTVDPATVPVWLTASPTSGTANTTGVAVQFTPVSTVLKSLAAGNYNATLGFLATGTTVELTVPVTLSVTNDTPTISVKGSSTSTIIGTNDLTAAAVPVPVTTIVSSDEPIGFNATCTVTTTYSVYVQSATTCRMTGASTEASAVTAIAYTYGTPLTTVLDPGLFAIGTPFGTVIQLTVTAQAVTQSGANSGSPVSQTFTYTIQPNAPTLSAIAPTSTAVVATGTSLVVTLTGTNFVGPGSINVNSTLAPTQVFVGSTNVTADSVVLNPTTLVVSIPAADVPSSVTAGHPATVVIGVNNQTASSLPTAPATGATETLTVTDAPVIYAITSTASYNQPAPGGHPHLAPFELISIFGANFGVSGSVTGTLSSFEQFPTSITLSGSGSTAVNLTVTFKVGSTTYAAPILFANATQINTAVPSLLTNGQVATVTVGSQTSATPNASDGLFTVDIVNADPGIFTLSSDGTGQAAILNQDNSVNGTGNGAAPGSYVSIYMTGLGYPNSSAYDLTGSGNTGTGYPTACVLVNQTVTADQATEPGYLQVVNTARTGYTPPSPAWTNIDGAVILPSDLLGHSLTPCFTAATATAVTVTFGTGESAVTATGSAILWAGFAPDSVAGLYQITVTLPSEGLSSGTYPVQVTLGTEGSSQTAVVTMVINAGSE